jgi:Tol biopolymer transport system component
MLKVILTLSMLLPLCDVALERFGPAVNLQAASASATPVFYQELSCSPDGTNFRRLSAEPPVFFSHWSPDGKRVASVACEYPETPVYVVHADGSALKRLTALNSSNRRHRFTPERKISDE